MQDNSRNYVLFKAISTFVNELGDVFQGDTEFIALALYKHLLQKTKFTNTEAVEKHIGLFESFVSQHADIIDTKDDVMIVTSSKPDDFVIKYSDKVHIDLHKVFQSKFVDRDTKEVIWKHIQIIKKLVLSGDVIKVKDSSRDTLSKTIMSSIGEGKEKEFITSVIGKIESKIDPQSVTNPTDAINKMMSSGVFTELLSTMNNEISTGNLDIGKLLQLTTSMLGNINAAKKN